MFLGALWGVKHHRAQAVWLTVFAVTLQGCTLVGFSSSPTPVSGAEGPERDGSVSSEGTPESGSGGVDAGGVPDAIPRQEVKSRSGNPERYSEFGVEYVVMATSEGYEEEGVASWYGPGFHGRRTSSGDIYDQNAMSAAHPVLPLPTYLEVTNLENGRSVVVRVNDRGPFVGGRIIDLSYAAAVKLGMIQAGTVRVRLRAVGPAATERGGSD